MEEGLLERINELYKKSKTVGLTEEEAAEQKTLRETYLATFRQNLKRQLDNIDIKNPDGTIENLGEKHAGEVESVFEQDPEEES